MHICSDPSEIEQAWDELEASGIHTYFQTKAWCLAWLRDVGPALDVQPVFVMGIHQDGHAAFLLPLQIRRKYGFLLLEFLTAPHASYGFGLFEKAFLKHNAAAWFGEHFSAIVALLPKHDTVYLRDLPDVMLGYGNPMLSFARLKGANHAYMMTLNHSFENLLNANRSAETQRSMRKRDKRLVEMGELTFFAPTKTQERKQILERMFGDHERRLAETGVHGVYGAVERGFLTGLTDPDLHQKRALIPYTLSLNGVPICVLLGGRTCGVFWAMITSLAEGRWRKHSPGELTLRKVIAAQCEDGLSWFDFSAGDSDYKLAWADTKISMHLILQASTIKGFVVALGLACKHPLKRMLKNNVLLRDSVFYIRKFIFGRQAKT